MMMEQPQFKILITGAAGLAGSAVVREFVQQNHPVAALVRNQYKAKAFSAFPLVKVAEGDMQRPETLNNALKGIEKALLISSSNPQMAETQKSFIDAAAAHGIEHIVKFSGLSAADTDSGFVFAKMHAEVERYLEQSGIAWTHLRPSQFMTEYLREVPAIVGKNAFFLPFKDARLVPIDLNDVAKAAFQLLTTSGHERKIYEMSGPESLDMHQVASAISEAVGRKIDYVNIPLEQRSQMLLSMGVTPFFVEALAAQTQERWKGREAVIHPETHRIFDIAPTTFAQFAQRNAHAFLGESNHVEL